MAKPLAYQRMSVLKRLPGMDTGAFRRHWRQVHGPLAARMPGLKSYRQSHVVDQQQRVASTRGPDEIDGFAQLWFENETTAKTASSAPETQAANNDLQKFVGAISLFASETNVVVPLAEAPSPRPSAKRMTLLYAKPGMSRDAFRREWFEVHGDLVARFPGIRGYHQHLITARLPTPAGLTDAGVDCQGLLEMWFDTVAGMDAAFASAAGMAGAAHAATFLKAITTYVVDEVVVVEV